MGKNSAPNTGSAHMINEVTPAVLNWSTMLVASACWRPMSDEYWMVLSILTCQRGSLAYFWWNSFSHRAVSSARSRYMSPNDRGLPLNCSELSALVSHGFTPPPPPPTFTAGAGRRSGGLHTWVPIHDAHALMTLLPVADHAQQ